MLSLSLRGAHYKSGIFYNAANLIKLGTKYNLRFLIAASYIKKQDKILDICAGAGDLKNFVPRGCDYTAAERSDAFCNILSRKKIPFLKINLHQAIFPQHLNFDIAVMVISLYQFRATSCDKLLEDLKKIATRVLIVEEVLKVHRSDRSPLQAAMNYLCNTEFTLPYKLFTDGEFRQKMQMHNYHYSKINPRYAVGLYEKNPVG